MRKAHHIKPAGLTGVHDRPCSWPGCDGSGEHRAPKSRDRLQDFHWFCLEHVREYNRSWNYFAGMEDHEFDAMVRSSATWDRPTWPLGNAGGLDAKGASESNGKSDGDPWIYWAARETINGFRDDPDPGRQHVRQPGDAARINRLSAKEKRAFTVLGLNETATLQDVKKRFKQLVKRYHPDANGDGSNPSRNDAAEQRLRDIIQAYSDLVDSGVLTNPV